MKCAVLPPFICLTLTFTRCSIPAPSQTLQLCVWEALGKLKENPLTRTLLFELLPAMGMAEQRALLSRRVPRRGEEHSQKDHTVLCLCGRVKDTLLLPCHCTGMKSQPSLPARPNCGPETKRKSQKA